MILRTIVYFVLTFFFTMLLGGLQQEAGLLPQLTFLPQWGPGIAGLLTMSIFLKKDGLRITFISSKMPARRYLWALLLPLGFGLLPYLVALLALDAPQPMQYTPILLVMMLAGAVGEEIGWRGYLQRRLSTQLGGLPTAIITGVLWTSFHLHYWPGGLLFISLLGVAFVSFSVMMHAILAEYEFNVAGATLFHLGINLTSALYANLLQSFNMPLAIAFSLVAALFAAATVAWRRDLFFKRVSQPALA